MWSHEWLTSGHVFSSRYWLTYFVSNWSSYVCQRTYQTSPIFPPPHSAVPNRTGVVEYIDAVCSCSRHHQNLGPPRPGSARFRAIRSGGVSASGGWQSLPIGSEIDQDELCETCTAEVCTVRTDLLADSNPQRFEVPWTPWHGTIADEDESMLSRDIGTDIGTTGHNDNIIDSAAHSRLPVWRSGNTFRLINVVTLRWAQLVPRWVTVFGRVNHLGAEPGTQAYSAWACLGWMSTRRRLGGVNRHIAWCTNLYSWSRSVRWMSGWQYRWLAEISADLRKAVAH